MDRIEKVVVACPKCGQKLRCEVGGAGTCPKCGTRVVFPESIHQADPELNREAFAQLNQSRGSQQPAEPAPVHSAKDQKKPRRIVKRILIGIFILLILGGAVFGGLKIKDRFFGPDDAQASGDAPCTAIGVLSEDLPAEGDAVRLASVGAMC